MEDKRPIGTEIEPLLESPENGTSEKLRQNVEPPGGETVQTKTTSASKATPTDMLRVWERYREVVLHRIPDRRMRRAPTLDFRRHVAARLKDYEVDDLLTVCEAVRKSRSEKTNQYLTPANIFRESNVERWLGYAGLDGVGPERVLEEGHQEGDKFDRAAERLVRLGDSGQTLDDGAMELYLSNPTGERVSAIAELLRQRAGQ